MVKRLKELVSIIIPIFNVEKWIQTTIDSVINQTYRNIEIILVNEGSTDGSEKILQEYSEIENRIIIINTDNKGLSESRNRGLEVATVDFILFVDGDDWIDKKTVEVLLDIQQSNDVDVVFYSYVREFKRRSIHTSLLEDSEIKITGEALDALLRRMIGPINEELSNIERFERLTPVWGKLYRRSVLTHKFAAYNENYPEDLGFNVHNLQIGRAHV